MQVTGTLKVLNETQKISEKFTKRDFVLTVADNPNYPQHLSFQLTQDKCSLLDDVSINDTITVHFNLRGREWKSPSNEIKYFNTLEAWKIEKGSGASSTQRNQEAAYESIAPPSDKEDLPF